MKQQNKFYTKNPFRQVWYRWDGYLPYPDLDLSTQRIRKEKMHIITVNFTSQLCLGVVAIGNDFRPYHLMNRHKCALEGVLGGRRPVF